MVILSAEESWVSGRAGPTFSEYHVVPPRQQWDIFWGNQLEHAAFVATSTIYIYVYYIHILDL